MFSNFLGILMDRPFFCAFYIEEVLKTLKHNLFIILIVHKICVL
jgi:hypothetical protein